MEERVILALARERQQIEAARGSPRAPARRGAAGRTRSRCCVDLALGKLDVGVAQQADEVVLRRREPGALEIEQHQARARAAPARTWTFELCRSRCASRCGARATASRPRRRPSRTACASARLAGRPRSGRLHSREACGLVGDLLGAEPALEGGDSRRRGGDALEARHQRADLRVERAARRGVARPARAAASDRSPASSSSSMPAAGSPP